ncbi:MAG: acylphosphatase [Euryarchaeota archaeon]|nr:acylphosphatase [Euryarchaeota archaeon]
MQTRAKIIVKGEVQRVGYRDAVEKIARKLSINGFVENLKPYDVRIVCESEDKDVKRFIGALKIDGDPLISVSDIAVEYEKPTGEFIYFEIKRGSTDEETAERLDIAALHLKNLTSVVSMMNTNIGGKIDDLGEHLGGKIDTLGDKFDAGREENREGFAMLGDKIDGINEDTGEMTDTLFFLKEVHRETLELKEKYEVLSRDVAEIKVKLKAD